MPGTSVDESGNKIEPDFSQPLELPRGGRPGRQTRSKEELDRRISFAACLLSQLLPNGEIKVQLQRRYQCSLRMCEKYISRGRERLQEWTGKTKEETRVDVIGMLKGLLLSTMDVRDKLAVIDRIIEIYGLAAPSEHTVRGDKENPLAVGQVHFYIPDNGRDPKPNGNGRQLHDSIPGAI